jgi:hypothetical protein
MATVVSRQSIVEYFSDNSVKYFGKWLLVKARNIDKADVRIPRLWWVLDCSEEEALSAHV